MSAGEKDSYYDCSFVSIHYIICECGETFPSEIGLKAHLETEHPHKRERKEFKCGVCGSIFQSEELCISHYEETHIIGDIKTEEEEVEEVEDQKPDESMLVDMEVQEEEHQVLHIPEEYAQVVQVTPDGQLVILMSNTKQEIDDEQGKEKKLGTKKKSAKQIVCEVCGKKYASNAALKYHQRVHTGERPYHCHLCPKTFAMPLFLQIHVRTHTGERPFQCQECPKAFSNKAALLRHDRVHTGEKPYECPMCFKGFTQSNSMKLHVATVHLKQPAPYKSKTRKLKAQERMLAKIKQKKIDEQNTNSILDAVENENEDGKAARAIVEDGSDSNMYEVIESEVISDDPDKEVYEIIYEP